MAKKTSQQEFEPGINVFKNEVENAYGNLFDKHEALKKQSKSQTEKENKIMQADDASDKLKKAQDDYNRKINENGGRYSTEAWNAVVVPKNRPKYEPEF